MSKNIKYEVRSAEVNEILTRVPHWLVRSGGILLLLLTLLLIIGASIFKYPDIISAPVTITSENLPAQLIAKKGGRIKELLLEDGDSVAQGEVIAIVENSANFAHYLIAKRVAEEYPNLEGAIADNLQLGELQEPFNQFKKSFLELESFLELNYHRKMIGSLKKELATREEQLKIAEKRVEIAQGRAKVAQELFEREKRLYSERAISQLQFENGSVALLESLERLESAKEELNSAKANLIKGSQTILDLELARQESYNSYSRALEASHTALTSQIVSWEQQNLFIAPLNGELSFTSYWQENQNISAGEVVFTVVPALKKRIVAKLFIPLSGAGKVKSGQRVNIRLDSYPYMEFGMVEGRVSSISLLPALIGQQRAYIVEVELPNGMVSNYNRELLFTEEMHGEGQIVTEESSLLRRVFNPLKHLYRANIRE